MITIKEEIKKQSIQALRDKDNLKKDILRIALGEMDMEIARKGKLSEERSVSIVRKIVSSNEETINANPSNKEKLIRENEILSTFLPQTMNVEEIEAFFLSHDGPHFEEIQNCPNDGAAMGMAMKLLKADSKVVNGNDVKLVVSKIRNG